MSISVLTNLYFQVQFKGQQLVKNINRFRSRRNYFLKIEQMKTGPLEVNGILFQGVSYAIIL